VPSLTTQLRAGVERMLDLSALANGQYLLQLTVNGRLADTQRVALAR
jgi:hypothetical protein